MGLRVRTTATSLLWTVVLGSVLLAGLTPGRALASATATVLPTATATGTPGTTTATSTPTVTPTPGITATTTFSNYLLAAPLAFEPNLGQTDSSVNYLAHGPGYSLFLTASDAVFVLVQAQAPLTPTRGAPAHGRLSPPPVLETALKVHFVNANPSPQVTSDEPLTGTANYFLGTDPSAWVTDVPTYGQVTYQGIYPGIDLVYYGTQGQLEYDWQVAPGADPSAIQLAITGTHGLSLDGQGNLLVQTALGTVEQHAPHAYQVLNGQRQAVPVQYVLTGPQQVGFAIGAYDRSTPLVIDPLLSYATYLGGGGADSGSSIAVDGAGNAYVTGLTASTTFPLKNALQGTYGGGSYDAFVTKLNASGTSVAYSTYLGGSGYDNGYSIAVDAAGNAYVAGYTASTNFPLKNAAQSTYGGGSYDAFVTKLNASGTGLLYSSYLGGSADDYGTASAVHGAGNAYVTGLTASTNFPTKNPFQGSNGDGGVADDAFVTKVNTTASGSASLVYSSYLGGNDADYGYGIAVDGSGNAYVTGYTFSTNFPLANAFQSTCASCTTGTPDAFVTKLNAAGSALVYSTYLGGGDDDEAYGIAVDGAGNAYVTGLTYSSNFPTANAVQSSCNSCATGHADAFVTKLTASGTTLGYSSYLGGSGEDYGNGIAVDTAGDAYVTGQTASTDFPTAGPLQGVQGGTTCPYPPCNDVFVTKLTASGTTLGYSSYLGGSSDDYGDGIAVDGAGNAYVTGQTTSTNFPTVNALYGSNSGNGDAFVAKVQSMGSGTVPWHPHHSLSLGAGLRLSVDLSDGHADLTAAELRIPGRGPDLSLERTWDSSLAQAGRLTVAGQGWVASLTPSMSGLLTGTVRYADASGAIWPFVYTGSITATPPYTAYDTPPGLPWSLTTSNNGYTLTNILTSEALTFDSRGRSLADTDAYGNATTLSYGSGGPITETNSGGRALAFTDSGLLSDAQSPLWQSSGGQQGQHVTYGYNGTLLTTLTQGAGSTDALTTTFGYSGTQLISVTTPYTPSPRTWSISYDSQGRVSGITSPVSTTAAGVGYTPAYTTTFTYNPAQTQVVQGAGTTGALTTTYSLDSQGEPLTVTDGLGHSTSSSYDQDHDVVSSSDANGNTTTNSYQYVGPNGSTGLITQTVQPKVQPYSPLNGSLQSPTITHTYSANNDLIATGLPEGGQQLYGYDGHHGVITTIETTATGTTWRGTVNLLDQYGEVTGTVDGRGVSVNSSGVAALTANAGQYTRHYSYDTQGDQTSASTAPITTTLNGVTTVSTPVTTTYGYDGDGNQTSVTSANGSTTTTGYDHLGRPITTTLPSVTLYTGSSTSPVETTRYDGEGRLVQQTDGNGDVTSSSYDPLGRLVVETNPVSGTTVYTYNATEETQVQDPQGNVTSEQYDVAGRLITETAPVSGTTLYQYDAADNTTAITQADASSGAAIQVETRQYDALNRAITDTVSGLGLTTPLTTTTRYDKDGNVFQVQQPNGDTVVNTYDLADQLSGTLIFTAPISQKSQASGPQYDTYSYDSAGNQVTHTDADGRTSTTAYDGDSRAVQQVDVTTAPTGTTTITTTPSYDPDATVITQTTKTTDTTAPGVVQTHTYTQTVNAADWVTSTSDDGLVTQYGYDAAGQPRTETIIDGKTPITTVLDPEGRATAIGENYGGTGPYTSTFGYNRDDLPVTLTLPTAPTAVQQVAQYDANSRLTQLTTSGASGLATPLQSATYGYNAADWTTAATGISGTDTITHDAQGRLTAESGPNVLAGIATHTYQWSYDGNGNVITSTADNGTPTSFTYSQSRPNTLLQTHAAGYPQPDTYYAYDQYGNTTAITNPLGMTGPYTDAAINTHLTYDAQSRPITITKLSHGIPITITLQYNAEGLRSRYTVSMTGTVINDEHFQYRAGELGQVSAYTATLNADGSLKSSGSYTDTYVYDQAGLPLELLRQQNGQTNRYWYILDGRNNVVAVTDSTGKVVDSYGYDSWGEPLPDTTHESVPQQYRYGGYWWDNELEWYWLSVRFYDPEIMRWVQPDPSEIDGVRTYAYVGDDPIDLSDPTGQAFVTAGALCASDPRIYHSDLCNRWRQAVRQNLKQANNPCDVLFFGAFCARNLAAGGQVSAARWQASVEQTTPIALLLTHGAQPVALLVVSPPGGGNSDEVTVFRIQGGSGGGNVSWERLIADENGNLVIRGTAQLSLSLDPLVAAKFLQRRGPAANVFTFKVKAAFAQKLRDTAVKQDEIGKWRTDNPGNRNEPPQRLDVTKRQSADQYGLPESMLEELQANAIPGSARYLTVDEEWELRALAAEADVGEAADEP